MTSDNEIMAESDIPESTNDTPEASGRELLLLQIADKLSHTRQSQGHSVDEVVRILKLRKRHVLALESGDWEQMPDDVYVIGFLRQYASYLNLDISDEIHRLKDDDYSLTRPLTFPDPPVAPSRRWAWIGAIAFIALFIFFNITSGNYFGDQAKSPGNIATSTTDSTPAPSPAESAADATETRPRPEISPATADSDLTEQAVSTDSSESPEAVATATTRSNAGLDAELSTEPDSTLPSTAANHQQRTSSKIDSPAPDSAATSVQTPGPVISAAEQRATIKAPATSPMHQFRFEAVDSPVWLQVFKPNSAGTGKGALLREVLLKPGFHASIREQTESLWITCGNAPALRIIVDGSLHVAKGRLGGGKKVLRDYRFSIEQKHL